MKRWRRRIGSGAATLGAAAVLIALPGAGTAVADPDCSALFGCSEVENWSGLTAFAVHDWTCEGSTGTVDTTGECVAGGLRLLGSTPGSHTPDGEDWDALRVDAGWCYRVQFVNWWGKSWSASYDRRGQSDAYVKVEDGSIAYVVGQSRTRCP